MASSSTVNIVNVIDIHITQRMNILIEKNTYGQISLHMQRNSKNGKLCRFYLNANEYFATCRKAFEIDEILRRIKGKEIETVHIHKGKCIQIHLYGDQKIPIIEYRLVRDGEIVPNIYFSMNSYEWHTFIQSQHEIYVAIEKIKTMEARQTLVKQYRWEIKVNDTTIAESQLWDFFYIKSKLDGDEMNLTLNGEVIINERLIPAPTLREIHIASAAACEHISIASALSKELVEEMSELDYLSTGGIPSSVDEINQSINKSDSQETLCGSDETELYIIDDDNLYPPPLEYNSTINGHVLNTIKRVAFHIGIKINENDITFLSDEDNIIMDQIIKGVATSNYMELFHLACLCYSNFLSAYDEYYV